MIEIGIVGFGSWGLCVLERTVAQARRTSTCIRVHVIEPGRLGGGVYAKSQPDYLVLNNPCGQLSLYASPEGAPSRPMGWGSTSGRSNRGTPGRVISAPSVGPEPPSSRPTTCPAG